MSEPYYNREYDYPGEYANEPDDFIPYDEDEYPSPEEFYGGTPEELARDYEYQRYLESRAEGGEEDSHLDGSYEE